MKNPYKLFEAKIVDIEKLTPNNRLFTFEIKNKKIRDRFSFKHGQFFILSIDGFGEAPFGFCSSPKIRDFFQASIDKRGSLTTKMFSLKKNDDVEIRGPYGNGFDQKKIKSRNLILIAGGCGLSPLRSIIEDAIQNPSDFKNIKLFYGCRSPKHLIFSKEYKKWKDKIDINLTVDSSDKNWKYNTGVVTNLLNWEKVKKGNVAFLVGPPIMYKFVVEKLLKLGILENDIYLSLERRMHCGIGVCQHCALVNGKYVCIDGPVFSYSEIKSIPHGI